MVYKGNWLRSDSNIEVTNAKHGKLNKSRNTDITKKISEMNQELVYVNIPPHEIFKNINILLV